MYAICKVLPALCRKDFTPKPSPNAGAATKRISGRVPLSRKLQQPETKKILLVMKLTAIILLVCCLQVSAKLNSQTVNLSAKAVTLEKVFTAIERQTGYTVVVNARLIRSLPPVSVEAKNEPLQDFLTKLLTPRSLDFAIESKTIVISIAKKTEVLPEPVKVALQYMEIHGRVVDSTGAPLSGASVTVKGKSKGTTTNARGEFTIDAQPGDVLVITFVGYESREIIIGDSNPIVVLKASDSPLDDVQIMAYGVTSRRINTGNISTVKAKDIETQPVTNPLLALVGRVPGLLISQQTGVAGSGISVSIQGLNSIGKGNDPFYVIDGVPYISQLLPNYGEILRTSGATPNGTFNSNTGNPLSFINPSDIESIEVLKDADATAIYGSRAANGAILITTKKGKAGEGKVEFNIRSGWATVANKNDLLNRRQYLDMRYEALKNDGYSTPRASDYDLTVWDTTRTTNWQKALIGGTAKYTDVNGTVSGGNTITQYLIGATYHKATTVYPGSFNDQRGSVHFNINSTAFNNKLSVQLSGNYLVDNNKLPRIDLTSYSNSLPPVAPAIYNDDGSLNWETNSSGSSTWDNPLAFSLQNYNVKTNNLVANSFLKYTIIPRLILSSNFGYTNLVSNDIATYPLTAVPPQNKPFDQRIGQYSNNSIRSWIIEPQLNYNRSFGVFKADFLVGTTFQKNVSQGQQLTGVGYSADVSIPDLSSATSIFTSGVTNTEYKYSALFGRINLNAKNRYIINLTGRRDGSSRFGSKNQFHNFGAAGVAWIFSDENWFKNNVSFISFGKLRVSYGTTGSDQIGDYQFLSLYSPVGVGVPYQNAKGYLPNGLPNQYLAWEATKKLQLGLDLGLIKDRLLLNVSYFRNRSSNQLVNYNLPIITGYGSVTKNFDAVVQNTGWEISAQSTNIRNKDFSWSSNFNITISRNKLLSFPSLSSSSYNNFLTIGQPLTIVKVYHYAGVDKQTGLYQMYNTNGIPTSAPNALTDKIVSLNTTPVYYSGLLNSFSFKSFNLEFLFQYVKQIGLNNSLGGSPGVARNQPIEVMDRWRDIGDVASHKKFGVSAASGQNYRNALASDVAYSDASFLRLKNIQVSWILPTEFVKQAHLKDFSVFIQGQNVLTFTKSNQLDPETRSSSVLPPLREIVIGIKTAL